MGIIRYNKVIANSNHNNNDNNNNNNNNKNNNKSNTFTASIRQQNGHAPAIFKDFGSERQQKLKQQHNSVNLLPIQTKKR